MHFSHFIDIVQHIIEDGKGFEMFTTYKLPHQPSIFFLNSKQSMNYFIRAQSVLSSLVPISSLSQTRWVPPSASNLKVNFVGAVIQESSEVGLRVAIRDHQGLVTTFLAQKIFLPQSVVVVQAMAVVQVVLFAKEIGLSTCILEGDSTKIINASRSNFDSFASFRHLIPDATFFAKSFHSVLFSHTQRQGWSQAWTMGGNALPTPPPPPNTHPAIFIFKLVYIQVLILAILFYKITFYPLNNIINSFLSNTIVTNFSTTFLQIIEIANFYWFAYKTIIYITFLFTDNNLLHQQFIKKFVILIFSSF